MNTKSSYSDHHALLTPEDDSTENRTGTGAGFSGRNYGATLSDTENADLVNANDGHSSATQTSRYLSKKGHRNLKQKRVHYTDKAFWIDIFTTFLDAQWRWLILTIFVGYFTSWLVFAGVWYCILWFHGDFLPENSGNINWRPCVTNMEDFTSAFLFSLETQQTTGYGYYHITETCATAIITLSVQSIVGLILEGLVVGLVLLKMSRAKKRTATLLFSRNAVISQRDGGLCLLFRVADLRTKSTLLQATIRAQIVTSRITAEGEEVPINQEELDVSGDGERGNTVLLLWPTTIIHHITDLSPLHRFILNGTWNPSSPAFEIIVILEGVVESTGLTTQARTSYISSEILWGHRFKPLSPVRSISKGRGQEESSYLDYSNFHETYEFKGPNPRNRRVLLGTGGDDGEKWSY